MSERFKNAFKDQQSQAQEDFEIRIGKRTPPKPGFIDNLSSKINIKIIELKYNRRQELRRKDAERKRQEQLQADEELRIENLRTEALNNSIAPKLLEEFAKSINSSVHNDSYRQYVTLEEWGDTVYRRNDPRANLSGIIGYSKKAIEISGREDGSINIGRITLKEQDAKSEIMVRAAIQTANRFPTKVFEQRRPSDEPRGQDWDSY